MVGIDRIFISSDLFRDFYKNSDNNKMKFQAKLIGILLHESFHYFIRKISNSDFSALTQRGRSDTSFFQLEGGYLFENALFGYYNKKYWDNPDHIMNEKEWNRKGPNFQFKRSRPRGR